MLVISNLHYHPKIFHFAFVRECEKFKIDINNNVSKIAIKSLLHICLEDKPCVV